MFLRDGKEPRWVMLDGEESLEVSLQVLHA